MPSRSNTKISCLTDHLLLANYEIASKSLNMQEDIVNKDGIFLNMTKYRTSSFYLRPSTHTCIRTHAHQQLHCRRLPCSIPTYAHASAQAIRCASTSTQVHTYTCIPTRSQNISVLANKLIKRLNFKKKKKGNKKKICT